MAYSIIDVTKPPPPKTIIISNDDISIFEAVPLLIYLLPSLFVVIILVFTVFGLIMSQMEFNHPTRLYNKLTLSENIDKYSLCRLFSCLLLQFNPFFNYVFKPNPYLGRPLRLLVLTDYFLIISSICMLYYVWLPEGVRIADIFWFSFVVMSVIILIRPRIQDAAF